MRDRGFLISHALVLTLIAKQLGVTARELVSVVGVSEKQVHKVTTDLSNAEYITKKREDREFRYSVNLNLTLRQDIEWDNSFRDFLQASGWKNEWS